MKYHVIIDQGQRDHDEDRNCAEKIAPKIDLLTVFDGHGSDNVSEYGSRTLPSILRQELARQGHEDHGVAAMRTSLARLDESAKSELPIDCGGSTVCAVLVLPNKIVTANIGDSRAILFKTSGETRNLSVDHKPDSSSELDRITRAGGFVTEPHQVDGVHRVMGRLSLSRAIGDWDLRPWVSSTPDVTVHNRSQDDAFLVIASDGIWDVLSSEDVTRIIRSELDRTGEPRDALQAVLSESRKRHSGDNVTVMYTDLRNIL